VIEALADQVELNSLVMLANKRKYLDRDNSQQANHIARQEAMLNPGSNGAMPGGAATDAEDGIVNRSPTTNYHYYNAPTAPPSSTTPVTPPTIPPVTPTKGLPGWILPVALATILALGAGGATWWLATRPTTNNPQKLPTYNPDTTIKFS